MPYWSPIGAKAEKTKANQTKPGPQKPRTSPTWFLRDHWKSCRLTFGELHDSRIAVPRRFLIEWSGNLSFELLVSLHPQSCLHQTQSILFTRLCRQNIIACKPSNSLTDNVPFGFCTHVNKVTALRTTVANTINRTLEIRVLRFSRFPRSGKHETCKYNESWKPAMLN